VLFYGFDDLTRLQIDAIETLGAVVGARVTVSLTYEHGRTAFSGRAATFLCSLPRSPTGTFVKATNVSDAHKMCKGSVAPTSDS